MKQIPLTQGKFALVDDKDYERLGHYNWHTRPQGRTFYASTWSKSGTIQMHRLIMGMKKSDKMQIDHIDHNGLNNQKSNLRICHNYENARNSVFKKNKTGYRNIYTQKGYNGFRIFVSYHNIPINSMVKGSIENAIKVRNCMVRILHGKYAFQI